MEQGAAAEKTGRCGAEGGIRGEAPAGTMEPASLLPPLPLQEWITPESVLGVTLAMFVLPAVVALWERRRFVNIVEKMPGPFALPVLGSIVNYIGIQREDLFAAFDKVTRRYWPIMRTWKGLRADIHISSADDIEVILGSTTHIDKSSMYEFIRPWLGRGLLTSSGRKWHIHRKLITPTFHFKILEEFFEVFVEKSNILVNVLEKELKTFEGFDIYPYITLCTLDIICETAMGTQINAQQDQNSEYVKAIYDISERTLERLMRPWLYPDFIFACSAIGKRYYKDLNTLHTFTKKVIQERKGKYNARRKVEETNTEDEDIGKKRRLAFLDLLLEASQGGSVLSDEDIREEVDTFMFEGHDTTSASLCWVLFLLGSHPDIQEKVAAELEEIFQGSDRAPALRDLGEMKYLERVIKESLRLYPSVPWIGRHLNEDVNVGEYTLPSGCDVTVHIYHVHRNPEYFSNPDAFDPDNFLPERVQGRHPYAYIPFSAGSRNCIGQKFALLEEKVVLSALLRRYAFVSLDREEDLKLRGELILRPHGGIRMRLLRRAPPSSAASGFRL